MYCKQCGKEVMEQSVVCPNCGALVERETTRKKGKNWLILGGAVTLLITPFMPMVSVWSSSASYMDVSGGDGFVIMALAVAAGLLGLFKLGTLSFIPAVIAFFKWGYDVGTATEIGGNAAWGGGVLIIACLVITIGSIVEFVRNRKKNPLA